MVECFLVTPCTLHSGHAAAGLANRPAVIDREHDMAFEVFQDPTTAKVIRQLLHLKRQCIVSEDYDEAARLTTCIAGLTQAGEELGKLLMLKAAAVDDEDFGTASMIRDQIVSLRQQVYAVFGVDAALERARARADGSLTSPLAHHPPTPPTRHPVIASSPPRPSTCEQPPTSPAWGTGKLPLPRTPPLPRIGSSASSYDTSTVANATPPPTRNAGGGALRLRMRSPPITLSDAAIDAVAGANSRAGSGDDGASTYSGTSGGTSARRNSTQSAHTHHSSTDRASSTTRSGSSKATSPRSASNACARISTPGAQRSATRVGYRRHTSGGSTASSTPTPHAPGNDAHRPQSHRTPVHEPVARPSSQRSTASREQPVASAVPAPQTTGNHTEHVAGDGNAHAIAAGASRDEPRSHAPARVGVAHTFPGSKGGGADTTLSRTATVILSPHPSTKTAEAQALHPTPASRSGGPPPPPTDIARVLAGSVAARADTDTDAANSDVGVDGRPLPTFATSYATDERPLPPRTTSLPATESADTGKIADGESTGPAPLTRAGAEVHAVAVDLFGEHAVAGVLTKGYRWKCDGLDTIARRFDDASVLHHAEYTPVSVATAVAGLLTLAVHDNVLHVTKSAMACVHAALRAFASPPGAPHGHKPAATVVKAVLPGLLGKLAHASARIREFAGRAIVDMVQTDTVGGLAFVHKALLKPLAPKIGSREGTARAQLLGMLLDGQDRNAASLFDVRAVVAFANSGLEHKTEQVRSACGAVLATQLSALPPTERTKHLMHVPPDSALYARIMKDA